jgi:sRNA-binding protein
MRHGNGAGTGDLTIAGPLSSSVICGDRLDISHSQAVPQAQDWQAQRKAAEQTIAALADLFRGAFVANRWEPHRPLARGIHRELIDRGILRPEECRLVLGLYVARPMYQRALAAGGARINLAGNPTDEVTAEEIAQATASVARSEAKASAQAETARAARQAAYAEHKRGKKQAVTPTPSDNAVRPRDGLADLKGSDWRGPRKAITSLRRALGLVGGALQ